MGYLEKKETKYYRLKKDDYEPNFTKGKIYPDYIIGNRIVKYPEDWKLLPNYPTTEILIKAIENDNKKELKKIITILKTWTYKK